MGIGQRSNVSHLRQLEQLIRNDVVVAQDEIRSITNNTVSNTIRRRDEDVYQNVYNESLFNDFSQPTVHTNSSPSVATASPTQRPITITSSPTTTPITPPPTNVPTVHTPSPTNFRLTQSPTVTLPTTRSPTAVLMTPPPPPRFFLGIFTLLTGHRRRRALRQALEMYNDTRVCSFGDYDRQKPYRRPPIDDSCQLIYTFVVGASPNGPMEILRKDRHVPLLAVPPADYRPEAKEFNDITFLRIQEQPSNQGKAPTWLNYASQIAASNHLDYIIKSDAKTFVHVDSFFEFNQGDFHVGQHWPQGARNVYSGLVQWSYPDYHIWMKGAFYILSRDLAESVSKLTTTERLGQLTGAKRRKDVKGGEDVDTGFAVMMNHELVHVVALSTEQADTLWKFPLWTVTETEQYVKEIEMRLYGSHDENRTETTTSSAREQGMVNDTTVTSTSEQ